MQVDTPSIRTAGPAAAPRHARIHAPASAPAADFALRIEPGSLAMPAQALDALRRWIAAWLDREPNGMFIMGCTAPGHRSARVEQLRVLRSHLFRLGVSEDRIRYTGDRVQPAGASAAAQNGPTATARLKLVRPRDAEGQVCSIRSLFDGVGGAREGTCTSAS